MTCKTTLMEVVKLRQDADDLVFHIGSAKHGRACPKVLEDGATAYAKSLTVFIWIPDDKQFKVVTLGQWLNTEEHLLSTLLLLGGGGVGKSKLMHNNQAGT